MKRFKFNRKQRMVILIGCTLVVFFLALMNFDSVAAGYRKVISVISPFLWGIALAYLLNTMMDPIENSIFRRIKNRRARRAVSLILTAIISAAIVAGFAYAVIPQLISSVALLVDNIDKYISSSQEAILGFIQRIGLSESMIDDVFGGWSKIGARITEMVSEIGKDNLPNLLDYGKKFGIGFFNTIIAVSTAMYILSDKERLTLQVSDISRAVFSKKIHERLGQAVQRSSRAFGGFLAGKLIDSAIIGIICFIIMLIFKFPYALLVSVIVGLTNIIPTFGPVIGGVFGSFIILIVDPSKALGFALFIILLQQFDGNILGPHILGDAIGLSALWILFAVVVCGALWGVVGMIVGVPLVAVIYEFSHEFIKKRLQIKGVITQEDNENQSPKPKRSSIISRWIEKSRQRNKERREQNLSDDRENAAKTAEKKAEEESRKNNK